MNDNPAPTGSPPPPQVNPVPDRNFIIDSVISLSPEVILNDDGSPPPEIRQDVVATFGNEETSLLASNHRAAIAFAFALEYSRTSGRALQVYFDADSRQIEDIRLPVLAAVARINPREDKGWTNVVLKGQSAVYQLRRNTANFDQFLKDLQFSLDTGAEVLVTRANDGPEITDVRLPPIRPALPLSVDGSGDPVRGEVSCITDAEAQSVFDLLDGWTCDPLRPNATCIPFLFPDNGCEARVHDMCRIVLAETVYRPGKLWAFPDDDGLEAVTRNRPPGVSCVTPPCRCFVGWNFHTTLYFCSSEREGEKIVVDPSLFEEGPVSEAVWFARLDNTNAAMQVSSPATYLREEGTPDIGVQDLSFVRTRSTLSDKRVELCLRAWRDGVPPYANCREV